MSVYAFVRRRSHVPGPRQLVALALLTLLSACEREVVPPPPEIRPVRAVTIEAREAGRTVLLTGTVQAQTEINQSFRIDGRLIERTVDIGDTVRRGQLIARLDPENEESSLQSVRAQLVEARSNYTRMSELVVENAVSRAQYEQAKALRESAEAQVKSVQGQLDLAQNRLSYTRLVSGVDGVVTARGPEPGEVVSAGRMIVQVAREGARDAVFDVPAQVKNNAPKQPDVRVALSDDPTVTAMGRVREVSPRADPVTGTFAVRVRLIDPPPAMRLGTTVTGTMTLATAPAIEIPATALVRTEGRPAVWVFDRPSGTVSLRNIDIGNADARAVQVTSGLKPGDVVVTAGVQALRPGQKVRLLEGQS